MFRFSPKRSLLVRLLSSLGPPPPPPRRYFSKLSEYGAQHRTGDGRHGAGNRRSAGNRGGAGNRGQRRGHRGGAASAAVVIRDVWRTTG